MTLPSNPQPHEWGEFHGANGGGQTIPGAQQALASSLRNPPRVLGASERLIRIVLHGLTDSLDGETLESGIMAPMATLGHEDPNRIGWVVNDLRHAGAAVCRQSIPPSVNR